MATVTVRGLDDEVRRRLRVRAAAHDRSMEAEAREILSAAVRGEGEPVGAASLVTPPACPGDTPSPPAVLSPREERVAQLVADGLTNRQIAGVLFLSERTVESHVSSILRKLGFRRRTTVAGWYAARPVGS